jgi:uncharacterized protein YjiS (DUF1127 family)
MSRTMLAPAAAHSIARQSRTWRVGLVLKAWWEAYQVRRREQRNIERLSGMSDRELKDIGVVRSQIDFAVRRGVERGRTVDLVL